MPASSEKLNLSHTPGLTRIFAAIKSAGGEARLLGDDRFLRRVAAFCCASMSLLTRAWIRASMSALGA